jgi:DeoD family purine-nucleoside phosphorylase
VAGRTIHIHPTAPLAARALVPGDPGRALALAQALLDEPRMFNHNRGLWGYTGTAADGEPLTIQSTGMGGPSAAIVVEELCELGLERVIRVGTCGALDGRLALGDLVVVREALAADGASRALGAGERVAADAQLADALAAAAAPAGGDGLVVSTDLFYDPDPSHREAWQAVGALAVEMEAATVLRVAELRGVRGGCLLAVSDLVAGERVRIDDQELAAAGERLGEVALAALRADAAA